MVVKTKSVDTGYRPRPLQNILHRSLRRFNVLVCHRRFGKTVFSINEMIDQALRCPLNRPQFAYIAPTYGAAKRIAWEYFKEFTGKLPGAKPHEGDLKIDIPRPWRGDFVRFMLLGAENPGSLRGIYLDGALLDEYAEMDPTIWNQVIRPALSDRKGWAIFIGTPKGENHFKKVFDFAKYRVNMGDPDWFASLYRASETGILSKEELEGAGGTMSPEEYDQEFECSFTAALLGSYFGKFIEVAEREKRVCRVAYDPAIPVDTCWDLGINDSTSIWCVQQVGQEIHLIDYIEDSGRGLDHYVRELESRSYVYREDMLPHDGAARELGTGKSREETLRSLGRKRVSVLDRWALSDSIHSVRMILGKCWFDEEKCHRGLLALKNYERAWDSKNQTFKNAPKHNWASHGASAMMTLAQGLRPENKRIENLNLPRMAQASYDELGGY